LKFFAPGSNCPFFHEACFFFFLVLRETFPEAHMVTLLGYFSVPCPELLSFRRPSRQFLTETLHLRASLLVCFLILVPEIFLVRLFSLPDVGDPSLPELTPLREMSFPSSASPVPPFYKNPSLFIMGPAPLVSYPRFSLCNKWKPYPTPFLLDP